MGGAMASKFMAEHSVQIEGRILLGAYLYGDCSIANTLTIYGSLSQSVEDKLDYTGNVVEIQGGNHAQFGNYGPQKGDPSRHNFRCGAAGITRSGHPELSSAKLIPQKVPGFQFGKKIWRLSHRSDLRLLPSAFCWRRVL